MASVTPGSNAGERYWEGERGGVTGVMTGGVGLSEREGMRGWAGSGASWAGCLPGSAQLGIQASSFIFYFFLLLSFSLFILISVLSFEGVLPFKIE
jgi:hypothetical protein